MARIRVLPCLLVLVLAAGFTVAACGESALSASSTCEDFMASSPEEQSEAISQLATEFDAPGTATPLGAPNVSYVCASQPEETLGDYFERAHEAEG